MDKWIKENKITATIVIVLVVIFGIFYLQKQSIKTESQNSKTLSATSDIDLQIKCASQAKTFFDYFITDPESKKTAELANHYNAKLNICFALVKQYIQTGTGASFSAGTQKDLYDAVEKKVYGSYSWMSQPPKNIGKSHRFGVIHTKTEIKITIRSAHQKMNLTPS